MNGYNSYPQYPPSHTVSTSSASVPNTGYSHTASAYPPPPRYPPPSWRDQNSELAYLEEKKINNRHSLATYGEAVKRHLDGFELEASLNEVSRSLQSLLILN